MIKLAQNLTQTHARHSDECGKRSLFTNACGAEKLQVLERFMDQPQLQFTV